MDKIGGIWRNSLPLPTPLASTVSVIRFVPTYVDENSNVICYGSLEAPWARGCFA
jgi:hypothetical protein